MSERPSREMHTREVARLWRERPRSRLTRLSVLALAALAVHSWTSGDIAVSELFEARRVANVQRFLAREIVPFELHDQPLTFAALWDWIQSLLADVDRRPVAALGATLAISVLAISLAGLLGLALAPFAARNLAAADPFAEPARRREGADPRPPVADPRRPIGEASPAIGGARVRVDRSAEKLRASLWRVLTALVRVALIFLRAIPEYVWAFLLLAMLGPSAWPAVLALAIHNAGILGKLGAESIENLEHAPPRALFLLGAGRAQIAATAVLPLALSRFLLYFFYRFETCVREATVLGMLGVVSLGYWIQDARSKHFYDEMLFFVALGACIVLIGDVVSALARSIVRRAG